MAAASYEVHLVSVDPSTGALTDHGIWAGATPGEVPEPPLNDVGELTITCEPDDPYLATVDPQPWKTEVRVDRNNGTTTTTIFAGPILIVRGVTELTITALDLLGHFTVRYVDRAEGRQDYLAGVGDFESGLAVWTSHGSAAFVAGTGGEGATVDTSQRVLGSQSAKLVSSAANLENYIEARFTITGTGVGSLITVPAFFRYTRTGFHGPADASFGLYVVQYTTGTNTIINADPDDLVQIDGTLDPDVWNRLKAITRVPAVTTVDVGVRLYSLGGTGWWELVRAVLMESLAFDNVDETVILFGLVDWCQDPGAGWSNLGIGDGTTPTGKIRSRAYQHADHIRGDEALLEYTTVDDGFDVWIDPATRELRNGTPRRGTDRTGTVTLTIDSNCAAVARTADGNQAASSIVVLGTGSGPDREEGNAETSSGTMVGGTTVRRMVTPQQNDPPVDTLRPKAARELAQADNPLVWEVKITDRTLAETVVTGDHVNFAAPSGVVGGYLADTLAVRIVKKAWDPTDDFPIVTLNPVV